MTHAARLELVRKVVLSSGGWNRNSRAALLAWATAQGINETDLVRLVVQAMQVTPRSAAIVQPPIIRMQQSAVDAPGPIVPTQPHTRWWLVVACVIGIAFSIELAVQIFQRIPAVKTDKKPLAVASQSLEKSVGNTDRTQPPPPVSFPTPPSLPTAESVTAMQIPAPLEQRLQSPLTAEALQRWRLAHAEALVVWPSMPVTQREELLESLAAWFAESPSRADFESLREVAEKNEQSILDPHDHMVASACRAMLHAQVRGREHLSPVAAGAQYFSDDSAMNASSALEAWALAQVPALETSLQLSDGRSRWVGWLQAVTALEPRQAREACVLVAIEAILHGTTRLDGQGISADVLGSLLNTLPSGPQQSGFEQVREGCVRWLRDASITSSRLWAFGGVWRSGANPPDAWLLPGERDSASARAVLAQRWNALDAVQAEAAWMPLLERSTVLQSAWPTEDASRIQRLHAWLHLLRKATALQRQQDPSQVAAVAPNTNLALAPAVVKDDLWSARLADVRTEKRLEALQSMRSMAPQELAVHDALALAGRALSPQGQDERVLAQDIIRNTLLQSPTMLQALVCEVALAADPRNAIDLIEVATRKNVAGEDLQQFRARAIAYLLAVIPLNDVNLKIESAALQLAAEANLWAADQGIVTLHSDAAVTAWRVVHTARKRFETVQISESANTIIADIDARIRRLQRLAPEGPRGFAAALAVLCDLQAAWLSVQQPQKIQTLGLLAADAATRRMVCTSALQQAAISLQVITTMQLACVGAQPLQIPAAQIRVASVHSQAVQALANAEALLAEAMPDAPRIRALLSKAVLCDASVAHSAAFIEASLALGDSRRHWLEVAGVLCGGAMLPALDRQEQGLALAQAMAMCQRGRADRMTKTKENAAMYAAFEGFASEQGLSVAQAIDRMRAADDPQHTLLMAQLQAAILYRLDASASPWVGSLVTRSDTPTPEVQAELHQH